MHGAAIPYEPYHPHLWYTLGCTCIGWLLALGYARWKLVDAPIQRIQLYSVAMGLPLYAEASAFLIYLVRPAPTTLVGSRLSYFHTYTLQQLPIDSFLSPIAQTLLILVLVSLGIFSFVHFLNSRAKVGLLLSKAQPLAHVQPKLATLMQSHAHAHQREEPAIFVIEHDAPLAFATGMLHPRMYITSRLLQLLNHEEAWAVVCHEWAHHMRRDMWWNFGLMMLRNMLAFLPPTFVLWHKIQASQDEACDRLATHITQQPMILAQALVKVAQAWHTYKSITPNFSTVNAFVTYKASPRQRVQHMIRVHQHQIAVSRLAVMGAYIVIGLLLILAPLPALLGS